MKNSTLFLLLGIAALFSLCANDVDKKGKAYSNDKGTAPVLNDSAIMANEKKSIRLFNKLMDSFSPDWEEKEMDTSIYPPYFGGAFVNEQGKFVIAATTDDETTRKVFAKKIGSNDFILQKVEFSYIDLLRIINKLEDFLADSTVSSDHPVLANFAGAYPDVVDNRVRVTLQKATDEVVAAFKKDISDSPAIIFEEGNRPVLH